ncbi:MAG: ComEC/Rec2 family competence protein [Actinomycetota bacterium]
MCAGAAWGDTRPSQVVGLALVAVGGLILLGRRRGPAVLVAGIAFAACGGGLIAASFRAGPQTIERFAREVPRCSFEGRVLESANGLGSMIAVETLMCGDRAATHPGVIAVDGDVGDPGAELTAEGWLLPLGDDGFEMARERAGAGAAFDPDDLEITRPPAGAHAVASAVREGLRDATGDLEPRAGALARGLSVGDTSDLDQRTLVAFRRAGLSHLLAVSGSNVAIVLGCVALLCARLALVVRVSACAAALVLFVVLVGPDASVLRAGAMGAIALAALAWGRDTQPIHLLGLAVIAVVAVRPGIVFSVGLHLSVAATLGIILWARRVEDVVPFVPRVVRLPLAVTLSAQLAVVPVIVGTFGELSVAAPAANLVAAPAVAPATILTLAGGVAAVFVPALGEWIATGAEPFALWILMAGDAFGNASWASLEVSRVWAGPLALAAVAANLWLRTRRGERVTSPHGGMALDPARRRGQRPAVERRVLIQGGSGGVDGG